MLVAAVFISIVSFASNLAGQRALDAILFDDRPAMVLSNMRTVSKTVRSGAPFVYEFDYTKRRECYPPKGSGEVTYRIWFDATGAGFDQYHVVDPATISYADPELHHRVTNVTIPDLPAGQYMMQWRVHFVCAGASKPQAWDGPMMPFEIVP